MTTPRIEILAPAKVNLHLAVGPVRPDGYHSVETILQTLELADSIVLEPSAEPGLVCDADLGIAAEENLVFRAMTMLAAKVGREPHFRISLAKRIPAGAGLGGGSSDAAAVLAGMAVAWGIAPDAPVLVETAARLGADVPFFLRGGAAVYSGRGDTWEADLPFVGMHVVLVKPRESVPTAAAYRAFDELPHVDPPRTDEMIESLGHGEVTRIAASLFNNMTTASVGLVAGIGDTLAWCTAARGVLGALMAGSGSAVFALCEDDTVAQRVATDARACGWWAVATKTRPTGVGVQTMKEHT